MLKISLLRSSTSHFFKLFTTTQVSSINSIEINLKQNLLLNRYNSLVEGKLLRRDEHQFNSVVKLNSFYNELLGYEIKRKSSMPSFSLFGSLFGNKTEKNKSTLAQPDLKGIYLYGGVGK